MRGPLGGKRKYVHPLTFMGAAISSLFAVYSVTDWLINLCVLQHSGYLYGQSWYSSLRPTVLYTETLKNPSRSLCTPTQQGKEEKRRRYKWLAGCVCVGLVNNWSVQDATDVKCGPAVTRRREIYIFCRDISSFFC